MENSTEAPRVRWAPICIGCLIAIPLFASQWYVYDASRGRAEPFTYYLWWSSYIWVLLTPAAIWFAWRFPIHSSNWQRRVPLHVALSLAFTSVQLTLEAYLGWVRGDHELSPSGALRHYFSQHLQVSLLTYWLILGGTLLYRAREDALVSRLRSSRLETQLSEARLEMLRRQLHPHFLFNALQAAATLVKEDADRAEEVLLRLAELLRISLDDSESQEIPMERELEILGHYIAIQTCRFGDRLSFDVRIGRDLLACAVPSMILQPLVENAVHHGIGMHKGSDTISIDASRQGDALQLTVSNLASRLGTSSTAGRGVGLATTRGRIEQLYGRRASLHLVNLEPTGVCAELMIPFRVIATANLPSPAGMAK